METVWNRNGRDTGFCGYFALRRNRLSRTGSRAQIAVNRIIFTRSLHWSTGLRVREKRKQSHFPVGRRRSHAAVVYPLYPLLPNTLDSFPTRMFSFFIFFFHTVATLFVTRRTLSDKRRCSSLGVCVLTTIVIKRVFGQVRRTTTRTKARALRKRRPSSRNRCRGRIETV